MVSVLLIWIYMTITCYVIGFAVMSAICDRQAYRVKKESSYLFAGITAVTVYAQIFSVFYKVGLWANIILIMICGLCVWRLRKRLWERLDNLRRGITVKKVVLLLALLLLFAYGTSTGIIHYDTGLYHAQSIRWIEEYGIVPGLGNLHSRLAYNSSSFCLSALYSFAFLKGQSYHVCAGYLALILAVICTEGFSVAKIKKPRLADFVRVMGIYYLLIIFDEMVSPASDYFMVLSVFYIIICWLDLLESKEESYLPYALLCVMCVSVVTIKLSGAVILLLVIKPAIQMIREKRGKEIAGFLGLGLFVAIPFFIRNVILSGWLVYPFTAVDLFDFDFKIPKGLADYDSREIQVWGRGFSDVTRYDEPITKWLPDWMMNLDGINKIFLLLAFAALVVLVGMSIYIVKKRMWKELDYLHVISVLAGCFLFWLTSAPLIRYGCVYLWVFPTLVWGYMYLKFTPKLDKGKLYLLFVLLFGCYKVFAFSKETILAATGENLLYQKDYENYENVSYELHGYTFYYPENGDRTGYNDFPASPVKAADSCRGETIEEGWKEVIHN